ncbi:MAG: glycosyltransferase family 39 protein [Longimicrobiales bacterium]|nr:glycosyltransferase family 39 protein [Longimicrobiales bacterium]
MSSKRAGSPGSGATGSKRTRAADSRQGGSERSGWKKVNPDLLRWGLGAAVTLIAAGVVWSVANPLPHLGGDNAGYIALAHGLLVNGAYTDVFDPQNLPHTKYPPVFSAILATLIALGARSWVALKTVAGAATVVSVLFTYLWAQRTLRPVAAFAVALLMALSVGVVYYSQWVLSDPVFVAFTMVALYALARAEGDETAEGVAVGWLAAGVVLAGLAYFTRSAGLPLVLAVLAWLALRRAWRLLAASGVVLGVPMLVWLLRGRSGGVAQYQSEFWMVNPYDPSLGTVGFGGLVGRVLENSVGYVTRHLPMGVVGADAPAVGLAGGALVGAALVGWGLRARRRPGPAEIFFPLYWGVILLWPTVWSGDRFALPLLPLVFLYGAVALHAGTRKLPDAVVPALATAVVLALLLPAAADWRQTARASSACPMEVRSQSVWACYGPRVQSFMTAATWSSTGLPDGSAVLSRKPRHFYLQSGVPSRAFAFYEDPDPHLELADALGARYILLDQWDGFARRYVGSAVSRRPGAFCFVQGFGSPASGGSQLLGVRAPDARDATAGDGGDVRVERCPDDYLTGLEPEAEAYSSSGRIPLLEGLDS